MEVKKVLILGRFADGQTWPAIEEAFLDCDKTVTTCDLDKSEDPDELLTTCDHFDGELIVCAREPLLSRHISDIRVRAGAPRCVTWNFDVRDNIREWEELFPLFRLSSAYYTTGLSHVPEWREQGINAFWLPQGLQDGLYHPPDELTEEDHAKYDCDVCFIGGEYGMHAGRTELLDALLDSDLSVKVWGTRGQPQLWGEEHNKAVACSKVNLSHSGWPHIQCYMSVRTFKIMGARGFCLANAHQGMELWIPTKGPDRVLDYYQTLEEAFEKIQYWVTHPEERRRVAQNGYRWARRHNTYQDRIRTMLHHLTTGKQFGDEAIFDPRLLSPFDLEGQQAIFRIAARRNREPEEVPEESREQADSGIKRIHAKNPGGSDSKIPSELRNILEKKERKSFNVSDETKKPKIITVGDKGIERSIRTLIRSIRMQCDADIHIVHPASSVPHVSGDVKYHAVGEWYKEYLPNMQFQYKNASQLKPHVGDFFEDGQCVLYMDGADTLLLDDLNAEDSPLSLVEEAQLAYIPAESDRDDPEIPGFHLLFGINPEDRVRANNGVFAFWMCEETRRFFQLWKALMGWGTSHGLGDMTAFNLALSLWDGKKVVAPRRWNWLVAESQKYRRGEDGLTLPDGTKIGILHGAGSGRQGFTRLREILGESE